VRGLRARAPCILVPLGWVFSLAPAGVGAAADDEIVVGSKNFTEGVILGELARMLGEHGGAAARHRRALGGTQVVFDALEGGEIDVYAEYTGTLTQQILTADGPETLADIREVLAERGIRATDSLGFRNNYALGMKRDQAEQLGIETISDLREHPDLVFRFGTEFMNRSDGWPGLQETYGLPQQDARGVEHELAYRGIAAGDVDVTDLYTTDAEIAYYDLITLEDDRDYFPEYHAVLLYRAELRRTHPEALASIERLVGAVDRDAMIRMNARVKLDGEDESVVAADFLRTELGLSVEATVETAFDRFLRNTKQHLFLVGVSLALAIVVAVPLGVAAAKLARTGQLILGLVGIAQTIPALAMLVFMIPLLGIGAGPAVVALFFYSLLPIVRNTHAGLVGIPRHLRESAEALGLTPGARLRLVELPLAAPSILAGIKTAAIIDVGAATLGALIGAGGYGQPILTGIRLDDVGLILWGAIPAAGMALVVQGAFELVERLIVPLDLRSAE